MVINRRNFVLGTSLAGLGARAAAAATKTSSHNEPRGARSGGKLRLIGVEEHFSIPEVVLALRAAHKMYTTDLDLKFLYDEPEADLAGIEAALIDLEASRIADMDRTGVRMQVLSLTIPGVQSFVPDVAVEFARLVNDRAVEVVKRHPDRFAALTAFAPQDPQRAVVEMERGINTLHFNGFIVNSHINNEYLDLQKFWPILEAAEALDRPIYIHPRAPAATMAGPLTDYHMSGSLWGFGVEAGTHAVRLMMSGALDRFPKLKIVLGHMGEALPFWLDRLDTNAAQKEGYPFKKNQLLPSDYFKRNFWISTSGVVDPLALRFCIDKIGAERIMWATDYPYAPPEPAVTFIETAPISPAQRQMIAHGNAAQLFHLDS